jgi:hypothetical protein
MPKKHSSEYFRVYLASAVGVEPKTPHSEVSGEVHLGRESDGVRVLEVSSDTNGEDPEKDGHESQLGQFD